MITEEVLIKCSHCGYIQQQKYRVCLSCGDIFFKPWKSLNDSTQLLQEKNETILQMWKNNAKVCKKRARSKRDRKRYRRYHIYMMVFKKILLRCVNLSPSPGFVFSFSLSVLQTEPIVSLNCMKTIDALQEARNHKSLFAITH